MRKQTADFLKNSGITVLLLAGATALSWWFHTMGLRISDIVTVYLLSVLLTACLTPGHCYGLAASILSFLSFNRFFTEPFFSLKIYDPSNIITVVIMTVTATITSTLTSKVKVSAARAREKEAESNALYQMTSHLSDAADCDTIAEITVRTVGQILSCPTCIFYFQEDGAFMPSVLRYDTDGPLVRRALDRPEEMKEHILSMHAPMEKAQEFCEFSICGQTTPLALLRIPAETAGALTEAQLRLVHSLLECAALMVLEKRMPDRNIEVHIPDSLLMVPMDVRLITQVLVNLLDNAGKHTPEDREISVSVEEQEHQVEFCVADRDNINIMVAQIARDLFHVKHVIARLYDPERESVYQEFGIETICPVILSAREIDRMLAEHTFRGAVVNG